ncbi:MAG: alpha/beta hydrolase [Bacteroidetes bacterium]|nr:alpha/beta hydrolase [Bacteroidota bacterium]
MEKYINGLFVKTAGNAKNQPIIFVHGFPLDHSMWNKQFKGLSKDYYCISYDIRGLGKSHVGDAQYTMEAFKDDLFSIIEDMKIEKAVLCGLSMGGYIALRAVEFAQDRFNALILCDTKAEADNDITKLARAGAINKINIEGLASFVDGFVPPLFAEEANKENKTVFNSTIDKAKQHNPQGVKASLLAMLSRTNTTPFLKKIKIPTLLLVGAQDKLTPPPVMRAIHEKIKDSEFGVAPRAGHLAPLENPKFVNDMISGFLKRRI